MYENDFSFSRLFRAYGRSVDFRGRSTRTELLGYWITTWLISTVAIYAAVFGGLATGGNALMVPALINAALLIPAPALAVRRAHDIGWPGIAALLLILPAAASMILDHVLEPYTAIRFILSIAYLAGIVMLLWKPQDGDNRYGPDPRLAAP
jgi:uncharacterized membrane protein YhaH (DUF805 family)